jgi:PAS domain S-box-containing protein
MTSFLNFWRRSLLVQLVSNFLVAALVTGGVMGLLAYYSARQALTRNIYSQLYSDTTAKADEIGRWAEDSRQSLAVVATSAELQNQVATLLALGHTAGAESKVQEATDFLTRYLVGITISKPDLQEIFVLDDQGEIIFSTAVSHIGEVHNEDLYFTEGQKTPYLQPLYHSPTTDKPTITVATPIFNQTDRRQGVLAAHVNVGRLVRLLGQQVGLGGEAYVVDAKGSYISAEAFGRTDAAYNPGTVGIQAAIGGGSGQALYPNYAGIPVVGTYRWIPALQVGLLREIRQSDAFAPAQQLGISIFIAGLIVAAVMTLGVLWLARQITRPILAITSAAQRVTGGDLNVTAPVLAQHEVGTLARTFNTMTSEVRRLYDELKGSEAHFRALIENATDIITVHTPDGLVTYTSPSVERAFGYRPDEITNKNFTAFVHPEDAPRLTAVLREALADPRATPEAEFRLRNKEGVWRLAEARGHVLLEAGKPASVVVNSRDITERREHEREQAAIAAIASALRTAGTTAEMFPIILDEVLDLLNAGGSALAMREPVTGKTVVELGRGGWTRLTGLRIPPGVGISGRVIAAGQPYITNDARSDPNQFRSDLFGDLNSVVCVPLIAQNQAIGSLWIGRSASVGEPELRLLTAIADIAANAIHRTVLHTQTEQRLRWLSALRTIDAAINTSQDLPATLYTILEHTNTHLKVDAAAILLFNRQTQCLDYAGSRGFQRSAITYTQLRLGESYAGQAVQAQHLVRVLNLAEAPADPARGAMVAAENFISYYGMPLISKGQARGILEIFHRALLTPDEEWEAFLEALAGEAAIAIENAAMFDELQHANLDLTQAYDATIEGWAQSLELRDRTPGHTLRVTNLTVNLAHALTVNEAQMIHLRRGAIMHDIGKMSLPDALLTKPEPLTGHEAEIMEHHPENAYKMLSNIPYLRPALDIPYCHHERWDGTGYPRKLAADQIPLAARIFAVVDLWDELRYRKAVPEDQARHRLKSLAGSHFDPEIVDVFLKLEII